MKTRGYTLIELMLVVAIVGILVVAIDLFLMFQRDRGYVQDSRSTTVESHTTPGPKCAGGLVVQSDGTVMTKDGFAVKC